jgi:AraC family transcriptional activator FtrA
LTWPSPDPGKLQTTDWSVEQIAAQTGMGTATTLRRHFNQAVGVPPETYRRTFRENARPGRRALGHASD